MDSFKNLYKTLVQLSIDLTWPLSASRTRGFFTLIITRLLLFFFFSPSDDSSPPISYTSLASRIHSDSDQVNSLSSAASPNAHFGLENYRSCTDSAAVSPVGTRLRVSRIAANAPLENEGSCIDSTAVSPVGTSLQESKSFGNGPSVLENPRSCTDSAVFSPVGIGTTLKDSRKFGNVPLVSENQRSCTNSTAVSPVGTIHQVSRNAGNAPSVLKIRRIRTNSAAVSPIGTSQRDSRNSGNALLVSEIRRVSRDSVALSPVGPSHQGTRSAEFFGYFDNTVASCDIFNGYWTMEEDFRPLYQRGSCPFVDDAFNCFKNGRLDSDYFKLRWKPHDCEIPRFDGITMLKMLRGKRMVFVGDSINRNMWEALVCALRESLDDKSKVFESSGPREFRSQGPYGIFHLCDPCGIAVIRKCYLRGFHLHEEPDDFIYENCFHVHRNPDSEFDVIDLL